MEEVSAGDRGRRCFELSEEVHFAGKGLRAADSDPKITKKPEAKVIAVRKGAAKKKTIKCPSPLLFFSLPHVLHGYKKSEISPKKEHPHA